VFGVSDKVLTITLSSLLNGARKHRPIWFETGNVMIAIDTLVHNFLHRTGFFGEHRQSTGVLRLCIGLRLSAAGEIAAKMRWLATGRVPIFPTLRATGRAIRPVLLQKPHGMRQAL
jgi:hypothetical protein